MLLLLAATSLLLNPADTIPTAVLGVWRVDSKIWEDATSGERNVTCAAGTDYLIVTENQMIRVFVSNNGRIRIQNNQRFLAHDRSNESHYAILEYKVPDRIAFHYASAATDEFRATEYFELGGGSSKLTVRYRLSRSNEDDTQRVFRYVQRRIK